MAEYLLRTTPSNKMSDQRKRYWHSTDTWTQNKADAVVFEDVAAAHARADQLEDADFVNALTVDVIEKVDDFSSTEIPIPRPQE